MRLWQLLAIFTLVALLGVSAGLGYSLARISGELEDTKADLASTQNALADTSDTLLDTQNELASTENTLADTQQDLAQAIIDLGHSQAEAADYAAQLAEVQYLYDNLSQGYSFIANDVTYQEVLDFLAEDTTDSNTYDAINYNCFNFTADVISHALERNIWCGFVYILFEGPDVAHAIVAFNTTDEGIIFIEPQSDRVVKVEVGKHYFFTPPIGYDDTVVSFVIIW